jgi:hypothetical protein
MTMMASCSWRRLGDADPRTGCHLGSPSPPIGGIEAPTSLDQFYGYAPLHRPRPSAVALDHLRVDIAPIETDGVRLDRRPSWSYASSSSWSLLSGLSTRHRDRQIEQRVI